MKPGWQVVFCEKNLFRVCSVDFFSFKHLKNACIAPVHLLCKNVEADLVSQFLARLKNVTSEGVVKNFNISAILIICHLPRPLPLTSLYLIFGGRHRNGGRQALNCITGAFLASRSGAEWAAGSGRARSLRLAHIKVCQIGCGKFTPAEVRQDFICRTVLSALLHHGGNTIICSQSRHHDQEKP